jgi:cytosine/uracil/thiamine/allantoin permease
MTKKAGGTGDIWNQEYTVHGSMRSWLILSSLSSITGGWATMATKLVCSFLQWLLKMSDTITASLISPDT